MSKIVLNSVADLTSSTTAQATINANSSTVQTAFDNTLSRDGTSPNQMGAALDMNSNQIFNLPAPSTPNAPARLIDVVSNPTIVVPGTGTSGHVVPFLDGNNTWSGSNFLPLIYGGSAANASLSLNATSNGSPSGDSVVINTHNMTVTSPFGGGTTLTVGTPASNGGFLALASVTGTVTVAPQSAASGTVTLPNGTDTLVGRVSTDTLLNKTLTSPVINTATIATPTITSPTITAATLTAGTISADPLTFTSGPVLTTASSGATEYDGNALYFTPSGTTRGAVPAEQWIVLSSAYTLASSNVAQKAFNVTTNGTVGLTAATTYAFEGIYIITNTQATAHVWSTLFSYSGTFSQIAYSLTGNSSASGNPGTGQLFGSVTAISAVAATASVATADTATIFLKGIFRTTTAGNLQPQIACSAALAGTQTMANNSYFRIYPIGSNTVTNIGNIG